MRGCLAVLVGLFLIPLVARAQDELIKDYSPQDFERYLKDELKKEYKKEKLNVGFRYKIEDIFQADYYAKRKFILFQFPRPTRDFNNEVTLEKINTWNDRNAVYTRVFLQGEKVVAEGTVFFAVGVTSNQVRSYADGYGNEVQELIRFFGGLKKGDGE